MLDKPVPKFAVSRVQPHDLLLVWPLLQPQIANGLRKGAGDTLTENGLFHGVANGELILWVVRSGIDIMAALFLKIEVRQRGRALVVLNVVAGPKGKGFGDYAEDVLMLLREYGDMIGAYTIESVSRLGAARHLMRHGCKPKAMIMELRDGRQFT